MIDWWWIPVTALLSTATCILILALCTAAGWERDDVG